MVLGWLDGWLSPLSLSLLSQWRAYSLALRRGAGRNSLPWFVVDMSGIPGTIHVKEKLTQSSISSMSKPCHFLLKLFKSGDNIKNMFKIVIRCKDFCVCEFCVYLPCVFPLASLTKEMTIYGLHSLLGGFTHEIMHQRCQYLEKYD